MIFSESIKRRMSDCNSDSGWKELFLAAAGNDEEIESSMNTFDPSDVFENDDRDSPNPLQQNEKNADQRSLEPLNGQFKTATLNNVVSEYSPMSATTSGTSSSTSTGTSSMPSQMLNRVTITDANTDTDQRYQRNTQEITEPTSRACKVYDSDSTILSPSPSTPWAGVGNSGSGGLLSGNTHLDPRWVMSPNSGIAVPANRDKFSMNQDRDPMEIAVKMVMREPVLEWTHFDSQQLQVTHKHRQEQHPSLSLVSPESFSTSDSEDNRILSTAMAEVVSAHSGSDGSASSSAQPTISVHTSSSTGSGGGPSTGEHYSHQQHQYNLHSPELFQQVGHGNTLMVKVSPHSSSEDLVGMQYQQSSQPPVHQQYSVKTEPGTISQTGLQQGGNSNSGKHNKRATKPEQQGTKKRSHQILPSINVIMSGQYPLQKSISPNGSPYKTMHHYPSQHGQPMGLSVQYPHMQHGSSHYPAIVSPNPQHHTYSQHPSFVPSHHNQPYPPYPQHNMVSPNKQRMSPSQSYHSGSYYGHGHPPQPVGGSPPLKHSYSMQQSYGYYPAMNSKPSNGHSPYKYPYPNGGYYNNHRQDMEGMEEDEQVQFQEFMDNYEYQEGDFPSIDYYQQQPSQVQPQSSTHMPPVSIMGLDHISVMSAGHPLRQQHHYLRSHNKLVEPQQSQHVAPAEGYYGDDNQSMISGSSDLSGSSDIYNGEGQGPRRSKRTPQERLQKLYDSLTDPVGKVSNSYLHTISLCNVYGSFFTVFA